MFNAVTSDLKSTLPGVGIDVITHLIVKFRKYSTEVT